MRRSREEKRALDHGAKHVEDLGQAGGVSALREYGSRAGDMWLFLYEAIADRTRCIVSVSQVSRLERIYVYIIHRERIFCGHSLMYVEDRLILKVIILIHPYL